MRKIWAFFCLICSFTSQAEISQPIQNKLPNGLRYTILPLHSEPGHIEIRMKVYAGSVDENDDQAGVAHMVEHLVFRGTEKHPNGLMLYLHANKWVRGRNYNAVTTNDSTTYMLTPPKEAGLTQSLDALAQMLFFAQITRQDLDDERKVILEEWRGGLGVGNRMNRARTNVVRIDSRYARHPVIGTEESIRTMPAEQLQQFYKRWYLPNNMQLLIVGDVSVEYAEKQVAQAFGSVPAKPLHERDYLEPKLSDTLRTIQLQDEQSGASQIAYILRFDESRLREQTEYAGYLRLLDRLALSTVTQRLRNEQSRLPQGIRSVVVRKSEIGKNTVALGVFAGVDEKSHRQGLAQIFTEIERLKRFPITETELAKQKAAIQAQVDTAKKHDGDRDFSGWVKVMVESVLMDKPYRTQPEIAAITEPMLHKISVEEINRHIQSWFEHQDRIIQYQAPRLTHIEPIEADFVKNLQKKTASEPVSEPNQVQEIEPMALLPLEKQGKIVSKTVFEQEKVTYFRLSNGDRVVWLKSPTAKQKSYIEAHSQAGFHSENINPWQSQLAVQLIAQNAPLDWEIEQLTRWKTLQKVNLAIEQKAEWLRYSGTIDNEKLADWLRLYYAYNVETQIKDGLDEVKESLVATLKAAEPNTLENQRLQALNTLRFGRAERDVLPTKADLEAVSETQLNQIWATLREVPTTFYLVNDMSEKEVAELITQYLAAIPRKIALFSQKMEPVTGREVVRFPFNLEPKDSVQVWFFRERAWQGKDAVLVSLLRSIVANKLKLSLRDEHLGVYSLRFDSTLNRETNRIESELSFSSDPQKTDELLRLAEMVLKNVAENIHEDEVKIAKAQFLQAEKARLRAPHAWLQRLILSDRQYQSPRYLSEVEQLAENITLENMRDMAKQLYDERNFKVFITAPKP